MPHLKDKCACKNSIWLDASQINDVIPTEADAATSLAAVHRRRILSHEHVSLQLFEAITKVIYKPEADLQHKVRDAGESKLTLICSLDIKNRAVVPNTKLLYIGGRSQGKISQVSLTLHERDKSFVSGVLRGLQVGVQVMWRSTRGYFKYLLRHSFIPSKERLRKSCFGQFLHLPASSL